MIEKEIKILNIKKKAIEKKLKSFGAKKIFEGEIHDVYYDFCKKNVSIDALKKQFRVRKKGDQYLYTIKNTFSPQEKDQNLVIKGEGEYPISSYKSFVATLEKYGLSCSRQKLKKRTSYELNGVQFDIDDYEGIPDLLEIEAENAEKIRFWIDRLGLYHNKILLKGSRGLFKYYNKEYNYF